MIAAITMATSPAAPPITAPTTTALRLDDSSVVAAAAGDAVAAILVGELIAVLGRSKNGSLTTGTLDGTTKTFEWLCGRTAAVEDGVADRVAGLVVVATTVRCDEVFL